MADHVATQPLRCAIYTRKSSEEGLEQTFNSLHAQREACEAYVKSQQHEGWILDATAYDDGAFSGGNMHRPALQALLAAIQAGEIDVVVVYKVDRLTRSLADFAKIVDVLDAAKASFVSVTQAFNTTSSMGRLTLNVLLSFAQFEREVTGERIRDKIAQSKAKGMWMGGLAPLGYDSKDRTLAINAPEAEVVQLLFKRFLKLGSVDKLKLEADRLQLRTKQRITVAGVVGGAGFSRGTLYHLLENPLYVGDIAHKGVRYAGQHPPIIDRKLFEQVQSAIAVNRRRRKEGGNSKDPSLLAGLLVDGHDRRFISTYTSKNGRRYRYYAATPNPSGGVAFRMPAASLEAVVTDLVLAFLGSQDQVVAALIDPTPAMIQDAIAAAHARRKEWEQASNTRRRALIVKMVSRAVYADEQLTLTLTSHFLGEGASIQVQALKSALRIHRRGADLKLVSIHGGQVPRGPDQALIRMVALGVTWCEELVSGQTPTLVALAQREGVTPPYVRRLVGLAFLAPSIKADILAGRQPLSMTTTTLRDHCTLPMCWDEQRALFAD